MSYADREGELYKRAYQKATVQLLLLYYIHTYNPIFTPLFERVKKPRISRTKLSSQPDFYPAQSSCLRRIWRTRHGARISTRLLFVVGLRRSWPVRMNSISPLVFLTLAWISSPIFFSHFLHFCKPKRARQVAFRFILCRISTV